MSPADEKANQTQTAARPRTRTHSGNDMFTALLGLATLALAVTLTFVCVRSWALFESVYGFGQSAP